MLCAGGVVADSLERMLPADVDDTACLDEESPVVDEDSLPASLTLLLLLVVVGLDDALGEGPLLLESYPNPDTDIGEMRFTLLPPLVAFLLLVVEVLTFEELPMLEYGRALVLLQMLLLGPLGVLAPEGAGTFLSALLLCSPRLGTVSSECLAWPRTRVVCPSAPLLPDVDGLPLLLPGRHDGL